MYKRQEQLVYAGQVPFPLQCMGLLCYRIVQEQAHIHVAFIDQSVADEFIENVVQPRNLPWFQMCIRDSRYAAQVRKKHLVRVDA